MKPAWKPGGKPSWDRDERPAQQRDDRPSFDRTEGRPEGKPKWSPKGRPPGRPSGKFEGKPSWDRDNRPARQQDDQPSFDRFGGNQEGRPEGKPKWSPKGRPPGRPAGKFEGKPNWDRDDRPRQQRDERPSFDRTEGKPKWSPKGRPPGRPAGKFEGRSNWDPDSRPGRKPGDRPMGRSEGRPDGRFERAPEQDRDERPRRFDDRPTGRFGDKPKWVAKDKPTTGRNERLQRPQLDMPANKQKAAVEVTQEKPPTHWGNVAEWYDELVGDEGSEYHQEVILPGLVKMMNIAQGGEPLPRVLDLACGQGVLCRRLAEYGCPTTGVDAAEELIDAARKRNEEDQLDIRYVVADVTQLIDDDDKLLPILEPESYDAATIVLSIQNITPLTPVWLACREALKPGGHLIIVMMHPCFRIPRKSDWFWNNANSTQSRLVSLYLSSDQIEIQTHPGLAAHGKDSSSTTHFHRPLQAYVNTLGSAGLLVDHIEEWTSHKTEQPGPKKAAIDRARKEIPMFLAIRARKV